VRAGARGDLLAGVHPRELLDALGAAQRRDFGAHRVRRAVLRHAEVAIGKRRDLRQMGHAHHLPLAAPSACSNRPTVAATAPPMPASTFVENQRRAPYVDVARDRPKIARRVAISSPPEATRASGPSGLLRVARHAELRPARLP
jgi:hypothetical protein